MGDTAATISFPLGGNEIKAERLPPTNIKKFITSNSNNFIRSR